MRVTGRLVSVGIASAIVLGSSLNAMAGSASKTYYGGASEFQEDYANDVAGQSAPPTICQQNPGVSEACFHVSGASVIHVEISDKSGHPTPARIWYYDDSFKRTDKQRGDTICTSGDVTLPDGTTYVDIKVGPVGREASTLPPPAAVPPMACGTPQPVTSGTITISGAGIGSRADRAQFAPAEPGQRTSRGLSVATRAFSWTAAPVRAGRHFRGL
jgi:hypothetical protein